MKHVLLASTAIIIVLLSGAAVNAEVVGDVGRVLKNAYGTPPDAAKSPKRLADQVMFQELLETANESAVDVKLIDGSLLTLGAGCRVRLDEFVFDPGGDSKALLNIGAGALRFVTGNMPAGGVSFSTPTATIVIRGTNLRIYVKPNGNTLVILDKGLARVTAKASGQSADLVSGDSILVTSITLEPVNRDVELVGDAVVDFGWKSSNIKNDQSERQGFDHNRNSGLSSGESGS